MPRKIRELETELKRAGFQCTPGKGSHRKWLHPLGPLVIISGKASEDAKRYQEKDVATAITATKP